MNKADDDDGDEDDDGYGEIILLDNKSRRSQRPISSIVVSDTT